MKSSRNIIYSILQRVQKQEHFKLQYDDDCITVYNNSYPAVPVRFSLVADDSFVEVRGVIGFYDSDYQREIMLHYTEEEKNKEEDELFEYTSFGLRRLPSFDFTISSYEDKHEVNIISFFDVEKIQNNPIILVSVIQETELFASNARRRFGHLILESSKSRIITKKEERRFYSTLMCSCPPSTDAFQGWYHIDLADIVNRENNYQSYRLINVPGANSQEELRENIVRALDGIFQEEDFLCLRYVFPEWAKISMFPLNALRAFDKYDDCLTHKNNIIGPTGLFCGERNPAFTSTIILFSNK